MQSVRRVKRLCVLRCGSGGADVKIEKVLNNNVVVALDENGAETVLMGRGLGFGPPRR